MCDIVLYNRSTVEEIETDALVIQPELDLNHHKSPLCTPGPLQSM